MEVKRKKEVNQKQEIKLINKGQDQKLNKEELINGENIKNNNNNILTKIKKEQQQQQKIEENLKQKNKNSFEQQLNEEKINKNEKPLIFAVTANIFNWREEVAMREGGKFVEKNNLNLLERPRSQTVTEKRKKLVKRKVSKAKVENELIEIKGEKEEKNLKEKNGHLSKNEEKMEIDNNKDKTPPQTPRTKKKLILVRKRRESTATPINDGVEKLNGLNNNHRQQQQRCISKKLLKGSNSMEENSIVGHDVFDFRLLRMKLQNRIMGDELMKDEEELATEAENKRKFELQKQQKELQTNLNIKMAMRKWLVMDKESKQQQKMCRNNNNKYF
ncbi:hypothetical protein Mgra_00000858 [Meloidogyne graminicola]|uniref:Uncharacterized protein n=1 Tax=Meloidogyne graminicola TaxID=189291 RepID=A0A8T0A2K2_9BILA|nr:hypothetical protein Mgra_00000858 [Meloidogyne graminicola]